MEKTEPPRNIVAVLAGLRQSMPDNWSWGDDPWERFRRVGIELADQVPDNRDLPRTATGS